MGPNGGGNGGGISDDMRMAVGSGVAGRGPNGGGGGGRKKKRKGLHGRSGGVDGGEVDDDDDPCNFLPPGTHLAADIMKQNQPP